MDYFNREWVREPPGPTTYVSFIPNPGVFSPPSPLLFRYKARMVSMVREGPISSGALIHIMGGLLSSGTSELNILRWWIEYNRFSLNDCDSRLGAGDATARIHTHQEPAYSANYRAAHVGILKGV